MIVKRREVPVSLLKYDALERRLLSHHPSKEEIEKERLQMMRGFRGEKSMDYFLDELPNSTYILHDLRLPLEKGKFVQLDTLLITPTFLVILEVKNFVGTIEFDPTFQQLIRVSKEGEGAYTDPLLQSNRQKRHLTALLKKAGYQIPIEAFVVISDPSTLIKSSSQSNEVEQLVLRPPNIPLRIEKLSKTYKMPRIHEKEMMRLANYLVDLHTPLNPNLLKKFRIKQTEIQTGIHCPTCSHLPLKRSPHRHKWKCNTCNQWIPQAHLHTLKDYALLISDRISTQECKTFLHLNSLQTAYRLINSLNLPKVGSNRNRKYMLSPLLKGRK